jgi:hypothetical protein
MSKHGWERGEIKLPSAEATSFRHSLVEFHNNRNTILFATAKGFYTRLKTIGKGKRNFDFHTAYNDMAAPTSYGSSNPIDGYDEIMDAIFPYEQDGAFFGRSRKPKAPKKNQFKHLPLSAKGISVGGEAGISFKGNVVIWSVSENNHSVERAHEHKIAQHFFKLLSMVKWTNRSGGEIVGNDEYNRDARESGGGANYVTMRFGASDVQWRKSLGLAAKRSF